jgi:hypothetical protein
MLKHASQASRSSLQIFRCSWQARTIDEHAASIAETSEEPTTNFSTHFSPRDRASNRLLLSSWSLGCQMMSKCGKHEGESIGKDGHWLRMAEIWKSI